MNPPPLGVFFKKKKKVYAMKEGDQGAKGVAEKVSGDGNAELNVSMGGGEELGDLSDAGLLLGKSGSKDGAGSCVEPGWGLMSLLGVWLGWEWGRVNLSVRV